MIIILNRVCLVGRLTKDPELRYSPSGVAVTNFTLAVERTFKNAEGQKDADFIPCVVFKQSAEFVANYLSRGKLASVDGRIQIRTYNDKDGQKRWVTEIICDNVTPLSPKDQEQQQSNNTTERPKGSFGHEVNLDDSDSIPF